MNREQVVRKLRELSGNSYFLATGLDNEDGFHVSEFDLQLMPQRELKKLLKQVRYDVTDKGVWFRVQENDR